MHQVILSVCVCSVQCLCTPYSVLHKNTGACVCNCMSLCACVCVCIWSPSSLRWALTFMEPAGHVRAHNDPRERPWAGGRAEEVPGGLGVDGDLEARNCCMELCDVCVCVMCVFLSVCVFKKRILPKDVC